MIDTSCFDLYGVSISVQSDSALLRPVVDGLLGPFAASRGKGPPDFQCYLTSNRETLPPELWRLKNRETRYRLRDNSYFVSGERSFIQSERGAVGMADLERREMVLCIPPDLLVDDAWCSVHSPFRLLLLDLLRTSGIFPLHCAANAAGERGVLVPASCGGGKSTFGIALTHAGLRFLVDDILLLRRDGADVVGLSLPDEVALCPESLDFFPELEPFRSLPRNGWGKVSIAVREVYPDRTADRCVPRVIVFPRVTHQPSSHLQPLSRVEAWCSLVSQSLWSPNSKHSQEHLNLLNDLVEQCDPYQLAVGTDLDAAARLVIEVLKEV